MGLSKSRTIALVVALATLTSNLLSSVLFSQLPDDPYHLAKNFGWYLHFANLLSVFGFIGAVRQHALSVAIFSNYLILDTILCAIPRFLILGLFKNISSTVCVPPPTALPFRTAPSNQYLNTPSLQPWEISSPASHWDKITASWSPKGCHRIVFLAQLTLLAGLIAGTTLQFVGALYVRAYAKSLWMREVRQEVVLARSAERRSLCDERGGLSVIIECDEELNLAEKALL